MWCFKNLGQMNWPLFKPMASHLLLLLLLQLERIHEKYVLDLICPNNVPLTCQEIINHLEHVFNTFKWITMLITKGCRHINCFKIECKNMLQKHAKYQVVDQKNYKGNYSWGYQCEEVAKLILGTHLPPPRSIFTRHSDTKFLESNTRLVSTSFCTQEQDGVGAILKKNLQTQSDLTRRKICKIQLYDAYGTYEKYP